MCQSPGSASTRRPFVEFYCQAVNTSVKFPTHYNVCIYCAFNILFSFSTMAINYIFQESEKEKKLHRSGTSFLRNSQTKVGILFPHTPSTAALVVVATAKVRLYTLGCCCCGFLGCSGFHFRIHQQRELTQGRVTSTRGHR